MPHHAHLGHGLEQLPCATIGRVAAKMGQLQGERLLVEPVLRMQAGDCKVEMLRRVGKERREGRPLAIMRSDETRQ